MIENNELTEVKKNDDEAKDNARRFFDNYHRDVAELDTIMHKFAKRYKHVMAGWMIAVPPYNAWSVALPMSNGEIIDKQYGEVINEKSFLEEVL